MCICMFVICDKVLQQITGKAQKGCLGSGNKIRKEWNGTEGILEEAQN